DFHVTGVQTCALPICRPLWTCRRSRDTIAANLFAEPANLAKAANLAPLKATLAWATLACERRRRSPVSMAHETAARVPQVDKKKIETAVRMILEAIGEDPEREGLVETPRRVAEAYAEMCAGMREDVGRHLEVYFQEE